MEFQDAKRKLAVGIGIIQAEKSTYLGGNRSDKEEQERG